MKRRQWYPIQNLSFPKKSPQSSAKLGAPRYNCSDLRYDQTFGYLTLKVRNLRVCPWVC